MSKERDFIYIQHILECINKIKIYTKNGQNDFYENLMAQDATLTQFALLQYSFIQV